VPGSVTLECRKSSVWIQLKDGVHRLFGSGPHAERGIALEVSPAEAHSWLAAVERKHQVTRRALELYMEDINSVTNKGLEEACIHVPPRINQLSWTTRFSHTSGSLERHLPKTFP